MPVADARRRSRTASLHCSSDIRQSVARRFDPTNDIRQRKTIKQVVFRFCFSWGIPCASHAHEDCGCRWISRNYPLTIHDSPDDLKLSTFSGWACRRMERSAIVVLPRKREDAGRACSLPSLTINPPHCLSLPCRQRRFPRSIIRQTERAEHGAAARVSSPSTGYVGGQPRNSIGKACRMPAHSGWPAPDIYFDGRTQQWKDLPTTWITVKAYRGLSESICQSFKKRRTGHRDRRAGGGKLGGPERQATVETRHGSECGGA